MEMLKRDVFTHFGVIKNIELYDVVWLDDHEYGLDIVVPNGANKVSWWPPLASYISGRNSVAAQPLKYLCISTMQCKMKIDAQL